MAIALSETERPKISSLQELFRDMGIRIDDMSRVVRSQTTDMVRDLRLHPSVADDRRISFGGRIISCHVIARRLSDYDIDISPQCVDGKNTFSHMYLQLALGTGKVKQFSVEQLNHNSSSGLLKSDFSLDGGVLVLAKQTVVDNTYFDNPRKGPFWRAYEMLTRLSASGRLDEEGRKNLLKMEGSVKALKQRVVITYDKDQQKCVVNIGTLLSNKDLVANIGIIRALGEKEIREMLKRIVNFQPALLKK